MTMDNFVQNVVSTAYLGSRIDLNMVSRKVPNIIYDPRKFIAAIIRLRKPKTTILLFHTGKIVTTGGSSINDNKIGARRVARAIQKI